MEWKGGELLQRNNAGGLLEHSLKAEFERELGFLLQESCKTWGLSPGAAEISNAGEGGCGILGRVSPRTTAKAREPPVAQGLRSG